MEHLSNAKLTPNAQKLRKNMTKEERHLWYDFLKQLSVTVHRQKGIGNYIVDFYCDKAKLAIEVDGSQHYSQQGNAADQMRDEYLSSIGITVLRYSNLDIEQRFESVCEDIQKHIEMQ